MSSDVAPSQNTVRLTYEMSPDQVEAAMGAMTSLATSAEASIELVDVIPSHSELPGQPPDPEASRSEVRGSIVQYVLENVDESNTLSGPGILRRIRQTLGLERHMGIGAMFDLTQEGIFNFRKRNEVTNQPEAVTINPHTIQKAVESGFLIMPPKEEPSTEETTPSKPEPTATNHLADVISPSQGVPIISKVSEHEPGQDRSKEQEQPNSPSSPSRPVPQAQELEEKEEYKDGRTEKNALFSDDATNYFLATVEVAALSDEAFLQLALTTKVFKRGFPTNGALKDAISEATGFEEARREKVIIKLLRERLVVHSKTKGHRLKLTEEGEQYLQQQVATVKSKAQQRNA